MSNLSKIKAIKRDIIHLKNNFMKGKVVSDNYAIDLIYKMETQIDELIFAQLDELKQESKK